MGNTAFVGENLKKGLDRFGHYVVLDENLHWNQIFLKKYAEIDFDIIHFNSVNFKKFLTAYRYLNNAKIVTHWHGSDLRLPYKSFPTHNMMLKKSDFHIYSTIDLSFWLRKISIDKQQLLVCPIDTEIFKPNNTEKKGKLIWGKGTIKKKDLIPHEDVPELLNQYEEITCIPNCNLSPYLISVSALESASCGCRVTHHPYMNREWVLLNASIESQTEKLLKIYNKVLQ